MNTHFSWVAVLELRDGERIEPRLRRVVEFAVSTLRIESWWLSCVEATGKHGARLTQRCNEVEEVRLTTEEILSLLDEDGQVIEMDVAAEVGDAVPLEIHVRDGSIVDVMGPGQPWSWHVLGDHRLVDPTEYFASA